LVLQHRLHVFRALQRLPMQPIQPAAQPLAHSSGTATHAILPRAIGTSCNLPARGATGVTDVTGFAADADQRIDRYSRVLGVLGSGTAVIPECIGRSPIARP
jgi:hypothetical protein